MKITNIKQQQKDKARVSFFVDEKYSFSLTLAQWQESGLKINDQITQQQLNDLKAQSDFGKIYAKALNYLARRKRSIKEMRDYLQRKDTTPEQTELILSKLLKLKYLNDADFARSWVSDRNDFKPSSKRKLYGELLKKGIDKSTIESVLENSVSETSNLKRLIESKRRQKRYQHEEKLIAYLCRNGFAYSDVKHALEDVNLQE